MNKIKDGKKIKFIKTPGNWGEITHFSFFDKIVPLKEVEERESSKKG